MNLNNVFLLSLVINIDVRVNCCWYSFDLVLRFHSVVPLVVHALIDALSAIQLVQINDPFSKAGFK